MKQIQINQTSVGQQDYNLVEKVGEDINVFSPSLYKAIDLDLPSGNLWADRNVGAATPEDAGLYFQWGDTQGYTAEQVGDGEGLKAFNLTDYKFSIDGSSTNFSKYNASDNKTVLDSEDDAARVNMGGNWRMPTSEECIELFKNTDFYLITNDDREVSGSIVQENPTGSALLAFQFEESSSTCKGVKFCKKGDHSVRLFIPSAGNASGGSLHDVGTTGFFWASSRFSEAAYVFLCLFISSDGGGGVIANGRYYGMPIRGIMSNV